MTVILDILVMQCFRPIPRTDLLFSIHIYEPSIAKISVTSPIVINMPTRELLAGETKNSFV